MKIHTAEKPDAAKVKRLLKAWDYGVEIEDMEDRFAPLSRTEIYKILKANGRNTVPVMSRQTMQPGTKPRTGRWSPA